MPSVLSTDFDATKLRFLVPTYGNLKGKAIFLLYEYRAGVVKPFRLTLRRTSSKGIKISDKYDGATQLPYRVHREDVAVWRSIAKTCGAYIRENNLGRGVKCNMLYAKDPSTAHYFTHYAKIDQKESKNGTQYQVRLGDMKTQTISSNVTRYLQRTGFELDVQPTIAVKSIYFQGLEHPLVTRLLSCRMWVVEEEEDMFNFGEESSNTESKVEQKTETKSKTEESKSSTPKSTPPGGKSVPTSKETWGEVTGQHRV